MENHERVERIKKMEEHYDALREYMDSGLWLSDYEVDERGEVPKDLKRGVLSQDGLYELLTEFGGKPSAATKPKVE